LYWATLGKFYGVSFKISYAILYQFSYTKGINYYLDVIPYTTVAAERTFLKRQITALQVKVQ